MNTEFRLIARRPTIDEFRALRAATGWSVPDPAAAAMALESSTTGVVALSAGESAVGMARMISDGALVAILTDVTVLPGYRGHGIGRALIDQLTTWAKHHRIPHIGLAAADHVTGFYRQAGFTRAGDYLLIPTPTAPGCGSA